MSTDQEKERLRRWRLILGEPAAEALGYNQDLAGEQSELETSDQRIDRALSALYESDRSGGLGSAAPSVVRWLGDIRTYFPASVVRVMQQDALQRLNLQQMLLEPELLEQIQPDVQLAATLVALQHALPVKTRETARQVVKAVVEQVQQRLGDTLVQAVRGSVYRAARTVRPRNGDIDWDRTIRANLKHYQPDHATIVPEKLLGHSRKHTSLLDIVLCVDQSGSMATSVVYAGIFGAVLATMRAITTRMIVFSTEVVDLSADLQDPVELLFAAQLGGGTDINRALSYCQGVITRPNQTILVLISDLFEGGNPDEVPRRAAELQASGVQMLCLLALNDQGAPAYDRRMATELATLGIPAFACTPDRFPDLIAAAISRQNISLWASRQEIVTTRGEQI